LARPGAAEEKEAGAADASGGDGAGADGDAGDDIDSEAERSGDSDGDGKDEDDDEEGGDGTDGMGGVGGQLGRLRREVDPDIKDVKQAIEERDELRKINRERAARIALYLERERQINKRNQVCVLKRCLCDCSLSATVRASVRMNALCVPLVSLCWSLSQSQAERDREAANTGTGSNVEALKAQYHKTLDQLGVIWDRIEQKRREAEDKIDRLAERLNREDEKQQELSEVGPPARLSLALCHCWALSAHSRVLAVVAVVPGVQARDCSRGHFIADRQTAHCQGAQRSLPRPASPRFTRFTGCAFAVRRRF
jgi:hypothetical protein